jgi:uncharacterized metal-binding protein YceD (DUF177 family)
VETICDRCGNPLTVQLWDEFNLIVKLVDDPDTMNSNEEDPDIFYIDRHESHFSIAAWIFEFINLSIPLQKVCKETEKGESTCNKEILDQLQKFRSNPNEIPNNKIWKDLDKFKDLGE